MILILIMIMIAVMIMIMIITMIMNWDLEVPIFVEGGKPDWKLEKNPRSKDENQQQTQSTYGAGSWNRTRDTLVQGERSHHWVIPAPILKQNTIS